jgi:hypothetical protein
MISQIKSYIAHAYDETDGTLTELVNFSVPTSQDFLDLLTISVDKFNKRIIWVDPDALPGTLPSNNDINTLVCNIITDITTKNLLVGIRDAVNSAPTAETDTLTRYINGIGADDGDLLVEVKESLVKLRYKLTALNATAELDEADSSAYLTYKLETKLLEDILRMDEGRNFYYTTPVENNFAIEIEDSLMNPQAYYDINNVNNSFVISKLDIDYLDSGIKIARSSRLN